MFLSLIVLKTRDIEKLAGFYELLGIKFEYHAHENGIWHYAATLNNLIFEIYPLSKNDSEPDKTTRLGFVIENLDKKISELQKNNYKIVTYPQNTSYGLMAVAEDCDKRKIELREKV